MPLHLADRLGQTLHIEPPEQSLVKPFVLALRGGFNGLAGDRFDAERTVLGDELPSLPRREGFNANPLPVNRHWGTPLDSTLLTKTASSLTVDSPPATWVATATWNGPFASEIG